MKKIVFIPRHDRFSHNRLFATTGRSEGWHLGPFSKLKEELLKVGYECSTGDIEPVADLLVFLDLPETRQKTLQIIQKYNCKCILLIMESPSGRHHFFNPKNHDLFDLVITYHPKLCDLSSKYVRYYLPVEDDVYKSMRNAPLFKDRKLAVMVNANKQLGWCHLLESRKNAAIHTMPFVGKFLNGWSVGMSDVLFSSRGELYSCRRDLARSAEVVCPKGFNVYGIGWNGERVSRLDIIRKPRKYACYSGFADDKINTLSKYRFAIAYENVEGSFGYISEKIFDAFAARTVPVYRGDKSAYDIFPKDALIDGRQFKSSKALLNYLMTFGQEKWDHMLDAASDFLKEERSKAFSSREFVGILKKCILDILN